MLKSMKILMLLGLVVGLQPASAALHVFACEPEWASLLHELAGDKAKVFTATTAHQDPHHIQARPSLIARIRRADLVVCSGAELEIGWLPVLLRKSGNRAIQPGRPGYFEAAKQVKRLEVPQHVDRAMGDIHAAGNPHIQTDPRRIARVARALTARLIAIDSSDAGAYKARGKAFVQRWGRAIEQWTTRARPLRGQRIVTQHRGWTYLFDWLGMEDAGELEPKPGVPPSAGHLAELKAQLASRPARMVIYAAYQNPRAARWLARETGIPAVELPFTVGGTAAAKDLFTLFDDTLARLLGALK